MGPRDYTVRQAVEDWLAEGLPGRAVKTVAKNKYCVEPLLVSIGSCLLRDLRADDVQEALGAMAMSYTTAAVRAGHSALTRSISYASARSLVTSNVAKLVATPTGRPGREPKAFTAEQIDHLLRVSQNTRMHAYIALAIAGIRAEEARSLRWDDVALDAEAPHVHVWRSSPPLASRKMRRTPRKLLLPQVAVDALRAHRHLPGGSYELVFASREGTQLDPANIRREFRAAVKAAGILGNWSPTELRRGAASTITVRAGPAVIPNCG